LRAVAAIALVLVATAIAAAPPRGPRSRPPGRQYADPSAVIAAEIAFARLAQVKGQWTAFRETATAAAEMFVPGRVLAQGWLKGRADPAVAVRWQPHGVWMSCDGSAGVTQGAWQGPRATGMFSTVWRRQRKGGYKWVLDQGQPLPAPLPAPEMIAGKVADCKPGAGPVPASPPPQGVDARDGRSADMTLQWTSWVWPGGRRQFFVYLWNGTAFDQPFSLDAPADAPGGG
jgi:hypothetical protein